LPIRIEGKQMPLETELRQYEETLADLARQWKGKYFVFYGREHLGPYDSLELAANAAVRWHNETTSFLIRRVGVDELQELLDRVTPENCHSETDWGASAGKEVW
jgi:hypothetical protein